MTSILRSKIIDILNASVGRYCHGIDKDHISVSVFNGEVRISDVAIKQDSLIHHGFPFSVSAGRVGSLVVLIPWASLSSQPIEILMQDLVLDICDSDVDTQGDISKNLDARAMKTKEDNLVSDTARRMALLRAQGSSSSADKATAELGRMGTLLAGAVKNLSCSLTNLTIRYTSRDGVSFVFHIDSINLMNVDENLNQAFLPVSAITRKCCHVAGISLISSTASGTSAPIFEPISTKLIISFESGADARLVVGDVSLCVDSGLVPVLAGIASSGKLRVAQSRCAAGRPKVPIHGNARLWWRYVGACVKTMVAPHSFKLKLLNRKISHYLRDYCSAYIKVLIGDDEPALTSRIQTLEAELHPDLICRFRDRCVAIVQSKGLLARKPQTAQAGGWFGWMSASPKHALLSEEELLALTELSFAPDSHVMQHDAAQPAVAAAVRLGYKASIEFQSFSLNFMDSNVPSFSAAISGFEAGLSFVDGTLSASCMLHRLSICESSASKCGQYIASSSLQHSDSAHQLAFDVIATSSSTSINGNISGIDLNLNNDSLSLLSHWLDKARLFTTQTSREVDAHGSSQTSSDSLKLVAMHIQRSPQVDVFISWQAPTVKLEVASGTLCLVLGHLTLKNAAADDSDVSPEVCPPALQSAVPHFYPGTYPCPSPIYHRFELTLIDFSLVMLGNQDHPAHSKQLHSGEGLPRIIAPASAQLSLSLIRGEFVEGNWPFAQICAKCNTVSFEICPLYCLAFNEAILMFIKLFSASASASNLDIIDKEFSRTISSYAHIEEGDSAPTEAISKPAIVLHFVSNVDAVSVRILGHDASRSDCSFVFSSSKTSLIVHADDVEAYMSVLQVTCCNNLQAKGLSSHMILSVNGGASQAAALLHFWYAEEGSNLWSNETSVSTKTIISTGPSIGLSLTCADAELNVDLFRYQGLLDVISNNLDAFAVSIKEDMSRRMESFITDVKDKMTQTGSAFSFEGNFSKLVANLLSGSGSIPVLSAELHRSSVKLVFSEGSTIDFCVLSDAFKLCDCMTPESKSPHAIIESKSSQSLQLSGTVSGDSLSLSAKLCKFHSNLFAPAVARVWLVLFPPLATSSETLAASTSTNAGTLKTISISLMFEGAEILFCDEFMSSAGFCLTAPTMQLSCMIENELTTIEVLEGADAFHIDALFGEACTHLMKCDGSISLTLGPSRNELLCSVKSLSLYISDRLLDYGIPFVHNVLGLAASVINTEAIVDKIIQRQSGHDFCITTCANALCLYLGDSSPTQPFIPLFEVEAMDASSKIDVIHQMHEGSPARKFGFEMAVSGCEARYSFQDRRCTVLTSSKIGSNLFSFGGTIANTIQPASFAGDFNCHAEPIHLHVDEQAFSLFIRVFANLLSAVSTSNITPAASSSSETAGVTCYCIGFNATFAGFSVDLSLNDTISGQFKSRVVVSSSFSQDSFKILLKWEDTSVALLQRAIDGRQSTIQQLLERTNFNFSFKSDLSSSEQSVMLAFLSPIVCNTSYMDIKRLYATFDMFLASFHSGIKTSRLSSGPTSPAVHVRVPSKSKLNLCFQADHLHAVFVNDCPPFFSPLLHLQLSKLAFDTCIAFNGKSFVVDWLKFSTSIALHHFINEASSCDDLLPAKKEIVFEEWSFAISSQLLANEAQPGLSMPQPLSHCQHITFRSNSIFELNVSHACVMSISTAVARMHRDWLLWMRSRISSSEQNDIALSDHPLSALTPMARETRRFVFMCMRNDSNVCIAVSHRGMPEILIPPQSDVSLDETWTNIEFTMHVNGSSKVCVVAHVPILIHVGGSVFHVQSEDCEGQHFVVFRGSLQVFNHTSLPFSLTVPSCQAAPFAIQPRHKSTRFCMSSFCTSVPGGTQLSFEHQGRSVSLSFDSDQSSTVKSELVGIANTVHIVGNFVAGVLLIRILPLFSIESVLPMAVKLLLSSDSNGSDPQTMSVPPCELVDVCGVALARDVWLAATDGAATSRQSPPFTHLLKSTLAGAASPSIGSSYAVMECGPLRHIISLSLSMDGHGVPVVSMFVSFVIKNFTHLPLEISLTSHSTNASASASRTVCQPHCNGQPSTAVLGTEKPVVWGDDFEPISMLLKVAGSSKQASSLPLSSFENSVMWLPCLVQGDTGSCHLALCCEPHHENSTLITIRYRMLLFNHTQMLFSFAVDPDLDAFTEVSPMSYSYLTEYAEPCRVVVRAHYNQGLMTQVSSLIPVVSQSDHALSLVFLNEATGATEQTFHIRTFEVDGTLVACICNAGDVQSSVIVSNETSSFDAFVSMAPSFQEKRIVCPASTVNFSTAGHLPGCSMSVALRATGGAPNSASSECTLQISEFGQYKPVSLCGRTLHVYTEPRHGMRCIVISENPPSSPLYLIGSSAPTVSFELDVPGIGVSCVDADGFELFYLRLDHVWFKWQAAEEESFELKIVNMQVDGPLGCGPDVIISRVSRPSSNSVEGQAKPVLPVLHSVLVRSSSQWSREVAHVHLLRFASVCLQELRFDLHEAVIYKFLAFLVPFSAVATEIISLNSDKCSAAEERIVLKRVYRQLVKMHSKLLFVRQLVIHSMSCLLSFTLAPNGGPVMAERQKFLKMGKSSKVMKTVLDIVGVGGIKDAKVNINSLRIENLFAPKQQLVTTLKTFFTSQLKGGALGFLGSLDALGNPKQLLMGYASAVSDIFIEPAASAVSSPKDVLSSMQHGTTSLLHNVVGSSLGSIASVSDAVSRGISSVTGNDRAHETTKIRSAGEGLKHGAKSFGMGLLSGITGVVTKPIEGARAEGGGFSFGGLMKGMATGIVGVVAQPVKGVADMISDVGKGIDSSTARLHGFKSVERLRAVPPPSRWLTLPYNHNSAVASTFLRQWQGATCSRPLVAAVLDLTGHSDWRCSVMVFHYPHLRNQPGELLFGHLRCTPTPALTRVQHLVKLCFHTWPLSDSTTHFQRTAGVCLSEKKILVLRMLRALRWCFKESVKCLSSADAVALAHFIATAEHKLPVSEQEETVCFRCKGHH